MIGLIASLLLVQTQPATPPDPLPADEAEAARLEAEAEAARASEAEARAEAEALADEIAALQARLVEAGRRISAGERQALASEAELQRLAADEEEILARLLADRESLVEILMALQRVERQRPPALLTSPDDAAEAARAAGLMAEIAPALRERAEALAADLERLQGLREAASREQDSLAETEIDLRERREALEGLIAERQRLETLRRGEADAYAARADRAGRRAQSIRSLINDLRRMADIAPVINPRRARPDGIPTPRLRPTAPGAFTEGGDGVLMAALAPARPLETQRFSDARGRLRAPVAGPVIREFGEPDEDGAPSEGIVIRARGRAQIVSPFDARIEYAGPFGAYGGLLILNVGDGYYVILAGMAALFHEAGQSVLAGEPVGVMPARSEPAPELYLELRRGDDAVDPRPWWDISS